MGSEDRYYRRRSDFYFNREKRYSRSRDDHYYRERYGRSRRNNSYSREFDDKYYGSRIDDRNPDHHRRVRDYDYSHYDRYDDNRRRGDEDRCFSRSSRDSVSRNTDSNDCRRTPERSLSIRRCFGSRKGNSSCETSKKHIIPRGRRIRGGYHGSALILHSLFLEDLSVDCSAVDLMRYAIKNVGMPDYADAPGEGKGIIGYHDVNKLNEIKSILEKDNEIPLHCGGSTTLTLGKIKG
uniref:Serrate RNA effector molecule n=1 Tax=Strongyloides stercoralis TaxID=6248 RepID=A0A0K0E7X7_STRER